MAEIKSFPNNQDEYVGAEWLMKWLHGRTSGIYGAQGNLAVSVVPNSMSVNISDGIGWLTDASGNGISWWNDTEQITGSKLALSVDLSAGVYGRIDRVIVKWQTTNYVARPTIEILKGTEAETPVPPALTNNNTQRMLSLARINIGANTTALTASMITDERLDESVCGIVNETIGVDTSVIQSQMQAVLNAIQEELRQIEGGSAYEIKKLQFSNTVVARTSFTETSENDEYPWVAAVPLANVLNTMTPEIMFSLADMTQGIFASYAESYAGGVYIYASEQPTQSITIPNIICWR